MVIICLIAPLSEPLVRLNGSWESAQNSDVNSNVSVIWSVAIVTASEKAVVVQAFSAT